MTTKHFKLLAEVLRETRPVNALQMVNNQWNRDVQAIVDVCESENLRFDKEKFLEACGGLL